MIITENDWAIARKQGYHFMMSGTAFKRDAIEVKERKKPVLKQGDSRRDSYTLRGERVSVARIAKLAGLSRNKANELLFHMTPEDVIKSGHEWKVSKRTKEIYRA